MIKKIFTLEMNKERLMRYKAKLNYLENTIGNLEEWTGDINHEYFVNELNLQKKYGIYHAFQIAVEIITDITAMIVKDEKTMPKDDYSNISILVKKKIIDPLSGKNLKEANGLRNRIVHDYNGLNDSIAYERMIILIKSFKTFLKDVNQWLIKNS